MPFNTSDFNAPPFVGGIVPLTHGECVMVKEKLDAIIAGFVPDRFFEEENAMYTVPIYNDANQQELINGDTYEVLKKYSPEVNTQGIDGTGIIPEPVTEEENEVPNEEPNEEAAPTEEEAETPTDEEEAAPTEEEEIMGA